MEKEVDKNRGELRPENYLATFMDTPKSYYLRGAMFLRIRTSMDHGFSEGGFGSHSHINTGKETIQIGPSRTQRSFLLLLRYPSPTPTEIAILPLRTICTH